MFHQVIAVRQYGQPEVMPFKTLAEAQRQARRWIRQIYNVTVKTQQEFEAFELKSGDFLWVTPLHLPAGAPLWFAHSNLGFEGDDVSDCRNRYFMTEAEAIGYAEKATFGDRSLLPPNFKVTQILPD